MRGPLFLFIVVLCFAAAAPAQEEDTELVDEFKRYFKRDRSPREKIEAIYVLRDTDTLVATQALVRVFDTDEAGVRDAALETIGSYRNPESVNFLIEKYLLNKKEKKEHRIICAVECLGRMENPLAVDPILEVYRKARSWEMKRALGTALGNLKSEQALYAIAELAKDKDPTLRVIALEAMAKVGNAEASVLPPDAEGMDEERCKEIIIDLVGNDDNWQVRSAAIAAIRKLRFKDGVQPLIDRMREEEGRLRGDAFEAIKEITFAQWGDNPQEWQKYWNRVQDRFEIPDLDVVLEARRKRAEEGTRYSEGTPTFGGIPTKSRWIVFVIDISFSMETHVIETDRFRESGRDYVSFERLEIVKDELMRTIETLDEKVVFNILAFATDMMWWKKTMVRANVLNRNSAVDFTKKLKPVGGGAAQFKTQAGLKAGNIMEKSKTNTYGALMAALGVDEGEEEEAMAGRKTFKNKVDTIFFLTDGEPTAGKVVDMEEIRSAVRRVNKVRQVVIHTIAIGDFRKNFLKALAEDNGGVYVDLGK